MCDVAERIKYNGRMEGRTLELYELVQDGDLSVEKASSRLNMSAKDFTKAMSEAGFKLPQKTLVTQ